MNDFLLRYHCFPTTHKKKTKLRKINLKIKNRVHYTDKSFKTTSTVIFSIVISEKNIFAIEFYEVNCHKNIFPKFFFPFFTKIIPEYHLKQRDYLLPFKR